MKLPIIYNVRERFTNCDTDGWQHWEDDKHVSFHSSYANAEKRIAELLQKKIDDIPACAELNSHIDAFYWERKFYEYQNNIYCSEIVDGEEYHTPLLFISEIKCED